MQFQQKSADKPIVLYCPLANSRKTQKKIVENLALKVLLPSGLHEDQNGTKWTLNTGLNISDCGSKYSQKHYKVILHKHSVNSLFCWPTGITKLSEQDLKLIT